MLDNENASLSGEELKTATPEDAERITRQYERDDFLRFQSVGYMWKPTRKMLIDHMRRQIDEESDFREKLSFRYFRAMFFGALVGSAIGTALVKILTQFL